MDNKTIMQMFAEIGALITNDHFVYTSGRHGSAYINKDAIYVHIQATCDLCKLMSNDYDPNQIDVVIGPTMGGVILSQWLAHHLNSKRSSGETLSIYAEKEGEGADKTFAIKRGYDSYIPGKNVVVVEDLLTTGDSARKVIDCVKALDGNVIGLSVLCNRGGVTAKNVSDTTIHALTNINLESWPAEECLLCRNNVPLNTTIGKVEKAFLVKQKIVSAL